MSTGFSDLPVEVIQHIFCFLDLPEIYALSALNRFCHTIYEDTPKLRYHSALLKAGMLDGADGRDVVNKLAYLEWKETSWAHFGLERTVHVVVRHRPSAVYELTAGFYLLGDASHTSDMPVFMRQTRALRCFDLTQLWPQDCYIATHRDPWPALTFKGTVAQDEHLVDFGVAIQEFDLIAVVTMTNVTSEIVSLRLRLMEFSTGRSHPLAASQILHSIYTPTTMGKPSVMVQISGRYLIYLVRWPRTVMEMRIADEVNLFDWWTGAHLVKEKIYDFSLNDAVFLSHTLVLIPNIVTGSLEIVRLPALPAGRQSNQSPPEPLSRFERVLILQLPALNPNYSFANTFVRSTPNPFGPESRGHSTSDSRCDWKKHRARRPYWSNPERALVLISFSLRMTGTLRMRAIWLATTRPALLDIVHRENPDLVPIASIVPPRPMGDGTDNDTSNAGGTDTDSNSGSRRRSVVPWAEWGPLHTRWRRDEDATLWAATLAGQRMVFLRAHYIVIWDFNPHAVACARAEKGNSLLSAFAAGSKAKPPLEHNTGRENIQHLLVDVPSSFEAEVPGGAGDAGTDTDFTGPVFAEEVISSLPYVEVVSEREYNFDGVLMDEGHVIGFRTEQRGGPTIRAFEVFII